MNLIEIMQAKYWNNMILNLMMKINLCILTNLDETDILDNNQNEIIFISGESL